MRNQKTIEVAGVVLHVTVPKRARPGEGSFNRKWVVATRTNNNYEITGGSPRIGGCGVGFEVTSPLNSVMSFREGTFKTLTAALEHIAKKEKKS